MAQARKQQQGQGHQQLLPMAPPMLLLLKLPAGHQGCVLIAGVGAEAKAFETGQQGIQVDTGVGQLQPGGAGQQIDTYMTHARLLGQALLDRPDTAATFHALNGQQKTGSRAVPCKGRGPSDRINDGLGRQRHESGSSTRLGKPAIHPGTKATGQGPGQDGGPMPCSPACPAPSATTTSSTKASR